MLISPQRRARRAFLPGCGACASGVRAGAPAEQTAWPAG